MEGDGVTGLNGELWRAERGETGRGGWWLVTALQGTSGQIAPYITLAHINTAQPTQMKIC